jgi:hypothetical protein
MISLLHRKISSPVEFKFVTNVVHQVTLVSFAESINAATFKLFTFTGIYKQVDFCEENCESEVSSARSVSFLFTCTL